MSTPALDTLLAANRYRAAGFTDAQVEALVETARETAELPDMSASATKADLSQLEVRLDSKIDLVRADLKAIIASTQVQTITAVLAAMVALMTVSTLMSKLIR